MVEISEAQLDAATQRGTLGRVQVTESGKPLPTPRFVTVRRTTCHSAEPVCFDEYEGPRTAGRTHVDRRNTPRVESHP